MCFTLPTPEDPFNDRNDPKAKKEQTMQRNSSTDKKKMIKEEEVACASPLHNRRSRKSDNSHEAGLSMSTKTPSEGNDVGLGQHPRGKCRGGRDGDSEDCLSKYLILCLKAIQDSWSRDSMVEEDGYLDRRDMRGRQPPLLACKWGIDFWKSCSSGLDIVDFSGPSTSREKIAWLVSTASDMIARNEKEGLLVSSPFLVFLVPSQEKATEVYIF